MKRGWKRRGEDVAYRRGIHRKYSRRKGKTKLGPHRNKASCDTETFRHKLKKTNRDAHQK